MCEVQGVPVGGMHVAGEGRGGGAYLGCIRRHERCRTQAPREAPRQGGPRVHKRRQAADEHRGEPQQREEERHREADDVVAHGQQRGDGRGCGGRGERAGRRVYRVRRGDRAGHAPDDAADEHACDELAGGEARAGAHRGGGADEEGDGDEVDDASGDEERGEDAPPLAGDEAGGAGGAARAHRVAVDPQPRVRRRPLQRPVVLGHAEYQAWTCMRCFDRRLRGSGTAGGRATTYTCLLLRACGKPELGEWRLEHMRVRHRVDHDLSAATPLMRSAMAQW